MFSVIACPRCRRARIVAPGRKQATCGSCARVLRVQDLRAFALCPSLDEAQLAAGAVNAKLSGRDAEFAGAFVPAVPRAQAHDSPFAAAAAAARRFSSEADRVDAMVRALSLHMRDFGEDDLATCFDVAGVPRKRVEGHLRRLRSTDVLFEPRPARYRTL